MFRVSPRACSPSYDTMSYQVGAISDKTKAMGGPHVCPRDDVVGGLLKDANNGVSKDLVGKIKPVGIFDEGETWLATAGVAAEANIRVQVWDLFGVGF